MPSPDASINKSLESRYFTDATVFEEETRKIFHDRWLYLDRSSAIENPGDYTAVELEGQGLILTRDREEQEKVYYNMCRHRGTRILDQASGHCSKVIRCPYHAWSYALDGSLVGAPHMEETEGFKKEDYPLISPAHATWEGSVFVHLGDDPEPFEESYAPILTKFAPWHIGELKTVHREVYEVAANWKLIVQNYSECYHCPSVHPELQPLSHYRATSNDLEEGPFLGGPMRITQEGGGLSRGGKRTAPPLPGLTEENLQQAYYYLLFPTLLVSLQPDFVLMHQLQRVSANHTRIICQWLYHPQAIDGENFDPQPTIEFWDNVNREDWRVSELTQKGIAGRTYTPGPYSNLESMLVAFDREYLKAMA
ncbi:MAG: aromatic ring-hydroxylating dioxygenase subunit alpha [Verrucomicrobiaceae bacterium]|nr:aromatic ring-hydroxylating dioxygenase subunit alpha [Verrucomicrobiaceae bacterium]